MMSHILEFLFPSCNDEIFEAWVIEKVVGFAVAVLTWTHVNMVNKENIRKFEIKSVFNVYKAPY